MTIFINETWKKFNRKSNSNRNNRFTVMKISFNNSSKMA